MEWKELPRKPVSRHRLHQVGITEADLDRLADDAMLQTRLLTNNPREVLRDDARAIYAAAL